MHQAILRWAWIPVAIMAMCGHVRAQAPIWGEAAMQPSPNTGLVHEMLIYRRYDERAVNDGGRAEEFIALTQFSYGVTAELAFRFDLPVMFRNETAGASGGGDADDEFGIGDSQILAKYRVWKNDTAATDTQRVALLGGLVIPGTDEAFSMDSSSDSFNPLIGIVYSQVTGRHGFNADLIWEFDTGWGGGSGGGGSGEDDDSADTLRYDTSYLFRIVPEAYTAETEGAWYVVAELNGWYETNGDNQLFLSPGVMYEAKRITLDASIMIPVWQDLDHRAEMDIVLAIGARISF